MVLSAHDGILSGKIEIVRVQLRLKQEGELTERTIPFAAEIPETHMFTSVQSISDPVKLVVDAPGWHLSG